MDCVDIVVGAAKGELSRIGDYYTRDRSSPLFDHQYGGRDSLTAALGYEEGDTTTILFRRKLAVNDSADWAIENALMHVIWARGQQENDIIHFPRSALEAGEISDPNFYRPDELKYHGHRDHRGATSFNFFELPDGPRTSCESGGCVDPASCPYTLHWSYDPSTENVNFQISATHADNTWVAIGFSLTNNMPEADILMAWFEQDGSGNYVPVVSDRYAGGRSMPVEDTMSDVVLVSSSRENGVSTFNFSRSATTADTTQDISLHGSGGECPFVFYGIGGSVSDQGVVGRHPSTPVQAGRICFGVCTATAQPTDPSNPEPSSEPEPEPSSEPEPEPTAPTEETTSTTASTTTTRPAPNADAAVNFAVPVTIRLINREFTDVYSDLTTPDALALKNDLEQELDNSLRPKIPHYVRSVITRFSAGSIKADFNVIVEAEAEQGVQVASEVNVAVTEAVSGGSINNFDVDSTYVETSDAQIATESAGKNDDGLGEVEIIIIAIAVAFCFTAIVVVIFKLWELKRSKNSDAKTRLSRNSSSSNSTGNGTKTPTTTTYSEFLDISSQKKPSSVASSGYMHERHYQQVYDNPGYDAPVHHYTTTVP